MSKVQEFEENLSGAEIGELLGKSLKNYEGFKRVLRRCRLVVLMDGYKFANVGFSSLLADDGAVVPKDYEIFDIVNSKSNP